MYCRRGPRGLRSAPHPGGAARHTRFDVRARRRSGLRRRGHRSTSRRAHGEQEANLAVGANERRNDIGHRIWLLAAADAGTPLTARRLRVSVSADCRGSTRAERAQARERRTRPGPARSPTSSCRRVRSATRASAGGRASALARVKGLKKCVPSDMYSQHVPARPQRKTRSRLVKPPHGTVCRNVFSSHANRLDGTAIKRKARPHTPHTHATRRCGATSKTLCTRAPT